MEYYRSFDKLKNSFHSFIEKTPSFGKSLICLDDNHLKSLLYKCRNSNFLTYGFDKKSNYQIFNVKKKKNCSIFDLKIRVVGSKIYKVKNIQVNLLGDHNVTNATASIAIALNLGIKISTIKKALKKIFGYTKKIYKSLFD